VVSEWTVDTLKEYFDALRDADREAVRTALDANERRFDSVNEFRSTLSDQAASFVTRSELNAVRNGYDEKIAALKEAIDQDRGKSTGVGSFWGVLGVVLGLVATVVAIVIGAYT
jgi:hypothetical protein